jgi:transcriptional regulator with PAS, ATPase and Fis domain
MFQRKLMSEQLKESGLRIGDSCSIFPSQGRRKAFTLNRHRIDFISAQYRPQDLSQSYIELPHYQPEVFHYRLELEEFSPKLGRFLLKTIRGKPFWINGLAAKEAYVERADRLYIEDHKFNFDPCDLGEALKQEFDHPVLKLQQLMKSNLKILIEGETGTGKTHLARQIHEKSGRRGEFVAINLSSYNPQLIESELFGHKKGAFTGAIEDKQGAFSQAAHGTLFLDEVDSLSMELQTKLLTFMDSMKYRRVGETAEKEIRTRLIFASGKSLETLVAQGGFRRDFYFRLKAGHTAHLLPLRNETKRIQSACQHFALKEEVSLSKPLVEFYLTLPWPGNLRQLFGHLEKKKIFGRTTKLDFDEVDEALMLQSTDLMSLKDEPLRTMEQVKLEHVRRAVTICEGNVALAARRIRLSEKTVRSFLQKTS